MSRLLSQRDDAQRGQQHPPRGEPAAETGDLGHHPRNDGALPGEHPGDGRLGDHLRRQRVHDDIDELADEMPGTAPTPEDERATAEIVARVRAAIARLPLGQRQVVTLVDLEELSYAEVALALGIPGNVPIIFDGTLVAIAIVSLLSIGPLGGLVTVRLAISVEPLIALGLSS